MAERKIVVIDAGHGGADPGAKFEGRQEKDDALRLALAVGKILSENGVDVRYTRTDDTYNTPLEKATMANEAGADYFVSIHRNAMPIPGSASGVMSLVFENKGVPAQLANNINEELANTGFANLGIIERPGLVVLRRPRCQPFWWRWDSSTMRPTTSCLMIISMPSQERLPTEF